MASAPSTSTAMLWFHRNNVGDFRVLINRLADGGYRVVANEEYVNKWTNVVSDPWHCFDTYADVCDYIDLLIRSTLLDRDPVHPFTNFQYSIPSFPDVVVPIGHLANETFYSTFYEALDYHLNW